MSHELMGAFPEETAVNPTQELRARCVGEIQQILQATAAVLDAGGNPKYSEISINVAAATVLQEACNQGDADEAETEIYLSLLRRVPASKEARSHGLAYATMAGSPRAADELHSVLRAEKQAIIAEAPKGVIQRGRQPEAFTMNPPILASVATAFKRQGISAEPWIMKYAPSPGVRWRMTVQHTKELAEEHGLYSPFYYDWLDQLCLELLDEDQDRRFVRQELPRAFNAAHAPDVRRQLAERYVRLLPEGAPVLQELRTITDMAARIACDPVLAETGMTSDCRVEIALREDRLRADGIDSMAIAQALLPWRVAFSRYEGYVPKIIVEDIDSYLGEVFQQAEPHGDAAAMKDFEDKCGVLMEDRDRILASYARMYAQHGDFTGAQCFAEAIASSSFRALALQESLRYARTAEHAATMQPDKTLFVGDPELGLAIQCKCAVLHQDMMHIESLTHDIVASCSDINDTGRRYRAFKLKELQGLHESAMTLDEQVAQPLVRQALRALRKAIGQDEVAFLSDVLLSAGDADEAAYLYEHMIQRAPSPTVRLQRLYSLVKRIPYAG